MKTRRVALIVCAILALTAAQALASVSLEVLNPASTIELKSDLAPRLGDLNGKRIAMWLSGGYKDEEGKLSGNGMAEVLFDAIAKEIKAVYPKVEIIPYSEFPVKYSPFNEPLEAILATNPDGVIVGAGG